MSDNTKIKSSVAEPRGMNRPGEGGIVEKPKEFKKTWIKLILYCKNYLPAIITALIAAVAGTVLQIAGPDKLKDMTNEITKGLMGDIDVNAVVKIAIILVFFYAGSFLLGSFQSFVMASVTQRISKNLRTEISQKVNKLPLK